MMTAGLSESFVPMFVAFGFLAVRGCWLRGDCGARREAHKGHVVL